jgi:hypothetical protein
MWWKQLTVEEIQRLTIWPVAFLVFVSSASLLSWDVREGADFLCYETVMRCLEIKERLCIYVQY